VAPYDSSCLNDLAVDVARNVAYIADSALGTLVVVDMTAKRSAVYQDATTLRDPSYDWVIQGVNLGNETLTAQADGIALTPDYEWVYWCPLQGVELYRAPAADLRALLDDPTGALSVELVANKTSPAGGMVFSKSGVLYSGGNADPDLNVWAWDSTSAQAGEFDESVIAAPVLWADTFGFDGVGNVIWTRNDLPDFFNGDMDFTKPGNFQVAQAFVNSVSYI
jgi:sugar lactone lactonase YvrE